MGSKANPERKPRKCGHCGHVGTDVHCESAYLGGHGYVEVWRCDDRPRCWDRWERQQKYVEIDISAPRQAVRA